MFTTLKLSSSLPIGSVVSFDGTAWSPAQDASQLVGVTGDAFEHEGEWYAPVTFAGTCFALASRAIAPERADIDRTVLDGDPAPLGSDSA